MKYSSDNGAIFDRNLLSRWFGQKNKRPDDECWELEHFVRNFVCGCGWDLKYWGDWCDFLQIFGRGVYKRLPHWFAENKKDNNVWAVIEKQEDLTMEAYFKDGLRDTEWIEV